MACRRISIYSGRRDLTTPFSGLFVSSTRIDVVQDAIRILFCDFDANPDNQEEISRLVAYLENVKEFLTEALKEEEIWIIFHPISRIIS